MRGFYGLLFAVLGRSAEVCADSSESCAERTFLPDSELPHAATLQVAAETSASWLEATRQGASKQVDRESALLDSASTALSNATGVNRDDEVATMLQLEKSYAASAKLIATVNAMLQSLLDAVR